MNATIVGESSRVAGRRQIAQTRLGIAGVPAVTQPRGKAKARAKANTAGIAEAVVKRLAAFVFSAAFAYLGSTLCGHVMVDQERREQGRAVAQARAAETTAAQIRKHLEYLEWPKTIEAWAHDHHFVSSDTPVPDSVVAQISHPKREDRQAMTNHHRGAHRLKSEIAYRRSSRQTGEASG